MTAFVTRLNTRCVVGLPVNGAVTTLKSIVYMMYYCIFDTAIRMQDVLETEMSWSLAVQDPAEVALDMQGNLTSLEGIKSFVRSSLYQLSCANLLDRNVT